MSDTLRIAGSIETRGSSGVRSGDPQVDAVISESVTLASKSTPKYVLASDAAQAVDLGGMSAVNFIMAKSTGGKFSLALTSADGSLQKHPVDSFFLLISKSVDITAIELTRAPGVPVTVTLLLGEKTS